MTLSIDIGVGRFRILGGGGGGVQGVEYFYEHSVSFCVLYYILDHDLYLNIYLINNDK